MTEPHSRTTLRLPPLLRALLEAASDPVWVLDAQARILAANEAGLSQCAVNQAAQILLRPLQDVLPAFATPQAREALRLVLDHGGRQQFEEILEHSATEFTVSATQDLQPPLLLVLAKDLTPLHTALEEQRRERQRFQYLLESLDGPVVLIGQDRSVRYCNRSCRKLLGNIAGEHCGLLTCQGASGQPFTLPDHFDRPESWEWQHQDRLFHMSSAPMTDADGETVCIIHGVDITRRRKAEQQLVHHQQQLSAIVTFAQEGIVVLSGGRVVFANPFMITLLGLPPEALTGQPFPPFIHPEDQARVLDIHGHRLAGRDVPFSYDCRLAHAGGGIKWVQVAATLLQWEGRPAVLAMLTDISDRKHMEQMLQDLLQEQDSIIHEKTNSLVHANQQLEQMNQSLLQSMQEQRRTASKLEKASRKAMDATRAKSLFLANMGHEIRTPLNVILGMAQVALRDAPAETNTRPLEMILDSGGQLLAIINDLLDFSKIEAHRLSLERIPLSLHELLQRIVDGFALPATAKGLQLRLRIAPDTPEVVAGDPARLAQVLNNLLSNALKFTSQGSITLSVRQLRRKTRPGQARQQDADRAASSLLFCVEDTGTGIAKAKLKDIFRSFHQADDSVARRYGGTGLGLTISRRLARMMRGDVWVRSQEGRGSRFFFSAQLEILDACMLEAARNGRFRPAATTAPLRILLAEDSPQNAEMLLALLSPYGHRIVHAADGRQALDALRHPAAHGLPRFDVVLMDVQMPVLDGLAATRRLRSGMDPLLPQDIPVIALTAHSMEQEVREIMNAGASRHVAKPVDVQVLVQALAEVTGGRCTAPAEPPRPVPVDTAAPSGTAWQAGRQEALARLGGSEALLSKLMQIFRQQAPQEAAGARQAWTAGRIAVVAEHAHTLKGNASAIGATQATETAARLEAAARQGHLDEIPALLRQLEDAVAACVAGMAQS